MTQRYLFFNSVPGDPRVYQASDFASYFGNVLSTGVLHIDNVPGLKVKVVPGTLQTAVEYGGAIMRGHLYENTEEEFLTHSLPESSLDRIDRIVLRLDSRNSERNILLHIKEGNPASNPVPPDLQRDNFIYELSLAQVRVRANTSSLQASDLKDERLDKNLCGLVYSLLGNSELERQFNAHLADDARHITEFSRVFKGDLNTLKANGFYYADSSATNKPTTGINGYVLVESISQNHVVQTFKTVNANQMFIRNCISGTWGAWEEVAKRGSTFTKWYFENSATGTSVTYTPELYEKGVYIVQVATYGQNADSNHSAIGTWLVKHEGGNTNGIRQAELLGTVSKVGFAQSLAINSITANGGISIAFTQTNNTVAKFMVTTLKLR